MFLKNKINRCICFVLGVLGLVKYFIFGVIRKSEKGTRKVIRG